MERDPRLRVERGESATGWWQFVRGRPDPRLEGIVSGLCGYRERASTAVSRRMAATTRVPIILSFGEPPCRHVISRFREQVGLTPKAAAEVVRFEHSANAVAAGHRLADVAARFGYSDQSHFTRDFARLAGTTPGPMCRRPAGRYQSTPESRRDQLPSRPPVCPSLPWTP